MEIINGIRIGQFEFDIDTVIEQIKWRCIASKINYAAFSAAGDVDYGCIGTAEKKAREQKFIEIAKFMRENKIYFSFTGTHDGDFGLSGELLSEMKEIGGDYFVGCFLPELGSMFGCKGSGFPDVYGNKEQPYKDMKEAKDKFIDYVNEFFDRVDLPDDVKNKLSIIEATSLLPYAMESKLAFPMVEAMCGNPEIMIPMVRATAKAHNSPKWITYIAHECYAGNRQTDVLKSKRLRMIYDYGYMCGSDVFILESGDLCIFAKGMKAPFNNPISQHYRDVLREFADYTTKDVRPEGGPKVKVAFLQGNCDGWSSWRAGSSLWNQFSKKEWGYSAPEFSWRIMDEINVRRSWHDVCNFGNIDLSGAPAYGQYDVINVCSPTETLCSYDYLIFTGWNTMTEEIYASLKEFVSKGGRLLMTAAHLNISASRNGEIKLIHGGDVRDLFGCTLDADNAYISNAGFKFNDSIMDDVLYPICPASTDPLLSNGYVNYAPVHLENGKTACYATQYFDEEDNPDPHPVVVENKVGEGYAVLITSLDYPGAGSIYPIYRTVAREIVTASHRSCPIKVYGSDRLRFSVYEGDKVYLLNTDFDSEIIATVIRNGEEIKVSLKPCEMKSI